MHAVASYTGMQVDATADVSVCRADARRVVSERSVGDMDSDNDRLSRCRERERERERQRASTTVGQLHWPTVHLDQMSTQRRASAATSSSEMRTPR